MVHPPMMQLRCPLFVDDGIRGAFRYLRWREKFENERPPAPGLGLKPSALGLGLKLSTLGLGLKLSTLGLGLLPSGTTTNGRPSTRGLRLLPSDTQAFSSTSQWLPGRQLG
jgi:hypothetical protein